MKKRIVSAAAVVLGAAAVVLTAAGPCWGMYHPATGRWLQRDPIGYDGGPNVYEYCRGAPAGRADVWGLSDRSDIPLHLIYSCSCGWIDWAHAEPSDVVKLWDEMVNERGIGSAYGTGFNVQFAMTQGKDLLWGLIPLRDSVTGSYFVRFGLSNAQKESVALGIFAEIAWRFEEHQAWWGLASGFSEEDITSDFLAFYMGVRKFSKSDIMDICQVLSPWASRRVYDETGGLEYYEPAWEHNHWVPQLHHLDSSTAACACADTKREWPDEFDVIPRATKGATTGPTAQETMWRDWAAYDTIYEVGPHGMGVTHDQSVIRFSVPR